ncbi:phasin family protein [Limisalsivibrio acetivorans]|uniref:phasin family protein n=1 Tax=Limisalsivibrio acetivorans TaxID=1304888 RepID=UPI0003B47871|nr:phasin family protein [Limisalsivibrio acetivorans]
MNKGDKDNELKDFFYVGLGAALMAKEKLDKEIETFMHRGKAAQDAKDKMSEEAKKKAKEFESEFDSKLKEKVQEILKELDIPTREEFEELRKKVEESK